MTSNILKCNQCGSYGLTESCECGSERVHSQPPKYSPKDKHAKYRQKAKKRNMDDQ